jgi:RNA recognition motif-containing protein
MSDDESNVATLSSKESKKEKKERKKVKKDKKERKESTANNIDNEDNAAKKFDSDSESAAKFEEIAIDLNAGVPLSNKQQRLLKKGKLDLEKLKKKHPAPKPEQTDEEKAASEAKEKETKKSPHGVWVGNLAFDTTKEDLVRFIVGKTADFSGDDGMVKIEEEDITRVNLPKKENKIKGFAYIDFPSALHVQSAVALSELILNGRKLLIKDATSFEGRPEKDPNSGAPLSKNPPSRILFVGNLSFDTSEDNLEEHFRHCGDIVRIRMATFEDTGKCKGFAFIDFKDEKGPTTALKSKLAKKLINRPLRLEYGEDRSKRNPHLRGRERPAEGEIAEKATPFQLRDREKPKLQREPWEQREQREQRQQGDRSKHSVSKKRSLNDHHDTNKRVKSSVALASAQRASAAIVPSQGKKISFD